MEEEFKKIQEIHLEHAATAPEIFNEHSCDGCRKIFEAGSADKLYICEVLNGYTACADCCRDISPESKAPDPVPDGYTCFLSGEDCKTYKLDEGWCYDQRTGRAYCSAHSLDEINSYFKTQRKFRFISNPRAFIKEVRYSERFYLESRYQVLYDEPVVDVKNLQLPKVLLKDVTRIKELCAKWIYGLDTSDQPWWSNVMLIDGTNTEYENLLAFKKYGSLRAWIPFEEIVVEDSEDYCFLVHCDSSKELFKQVMMLTVLEDKTIYAHGTKVNIDQYFERKYELLTMLEVLLVDFPAALTKIIWEYAYDELKLVEFIRQSIK